MCLAAMLLVASTAATWRDDFDSAKLNERWQWRCPVAGPRYSLSDRPGWCRFTLPQRDAGYNHWMPGRHDRDAPMLITAAPDGDFYFEAHLWLARFGPDSNFHAAMVIGFSPGYVLAWGPFRAPALGKPRDEPELWCEPTGVAHFIAVPPPARDLFLRIERRGDTYQLLYRRPGRDSASSQPGTTPSAPASPRQPWITAGDYYAFAPPEFIGFMGKTFGSGQAVVFEVDYAEVGGLASSGPARARSAAQGKGGTRLSQPASATLTVRVERPIRLDIKRFGHFIEHMHRCIYGGLWAEKLYNRKFTGTTVNGVVEGWRRIGSSSARFETDNEQWYVPCQSQRIVIRGRERAGIAQGPMAFRAGVPHVGYVIAKSKPAGVNLNIELWQDDKRLSRAHLGPLTTAWAKYRFSLPSLDRVTEAELRITARGPGIVWLGAASLMPGDNVDGWRRDVLAAVDAVRPPLIRWPGGNFASQYDWREGIGDRDRRPPRWNRAWNHWEWNDVGTDEFIRLCRLLDAEPYICANAGEGTAIEAAEWVEYCNGSPDTPMGAMRASNGYPHPYNVKLWGLGNEMYGNWQHGHLDPVKYALKALDMAYAMRRADASLRFVLVGVEGRAFGNWNEKVASLAGRRMDYLSVHHYTALDARADSLAAYAIAVSAPARVERMLIETWRLVRRATRGQALPVCFDEWNIVRPQRDDLPGHLGFYCLRDALFAAQVFNALNRLGPKVPIACVTQTVNVLGLIRVNETTVAPTPSYWVLKMFRDRAGRVSLPVTYEGPTAVFPLGAGQLPLLDCSATADPAQRRLYVFFVNRSASRAVAIRIRLPSGWDARITEVRAVRGDSYHAANDYDHPNAVTLERAGDLRRGPTSVLVPPHSAVAATLALGDRA